MRVAIGYNFSKRGIMTFLWGFLSGTACAWAVFVGIVWYVNHIAEQQTKQDQVTLKANADRVREIVKQAPHPGPDAGKED